MAMDENIRLAGAPEFLVVTLDRASHRSDPITIANEIGPKKLRESEVWLFSFGAYGDTRVAVIGNSLDDALEIAAEVLSKVAPGIFVALDLPEDFNDLDEEAQQEAHEEAEADLTYTESGYLPSWEWCVSELSAWDGANKSLRGRILDKVIGRAHKEALRDYHARHPAHDYDHTPRPKPSEIEYA